MLFHHRGEGIATLNRIDQFYNMRLYKPPHITSLKPEAIIIGSSRTGTMRPRHPSWDGLAAYNLSIPGMTLSELTALVKHAQANGPLDKLMIGLDYQALVTPVPVYRTGFAPERLMSDASDAASARYMLQKIRDLRATLFSFDILGQSVKALAGVGSQVRKYYPDGAWASTSNRMKGRGGYIYVAENTAKVDPSITFGNEENLQVFAIYSISATAMLSIHSFSSLLHTCSLSISGSAWHRRNSGAAHTVRSSPSMRTWRNSTVSHPSGSGDLVTISRSRPSRYFRPGYRQGLV